MIYDFSSKEYYDQIAAKTRAWSEKMAKEQRRKDLIKNIFIDSVISLITQIMVDRYFNANAENQDESK